MNNFCFYRLYLVAMMITIHHCFDAGNNESLAWPRNEKDRFEPLGNAPNQSTVVDCLGGCCQCRNENTQIYCEPTLNKCQDLFLINEENMDQEEGYYFLPQQASELRIIGFQLLKIKEFSFPSSIKAVVIENVEKVVIEKNGLWKPHCAPSEKKKPPSEIRITNCSITSLGNGSFSGGWTNISIVNSNLPHLESFAFINLLCLNEFSLERNKIKIVQKESLSKSKCRILTVKENDIETIDTHGFNAEIIASVNIAGNIIKEIRTEAFALSRPKSFRLYNNAIGSVNRHAIQLSANYIHIQLNSFGQLMPHVFHYLKMKQLHHPSNNANKMAMKDNIFFNTGPDALKLNETIGIDGSVLEISQLSLQKNCECDLQQQVDELYIIPANTDDENGGHATVKEMVINAITCRLNYSHSISAKEFFHSSGCPVQDEFSEKPISDRQEGWVIGVIIVAFVLVALLLSLLLRVIYLNRKRDKMLRFTRERLLNSGNPEQINPEIPVVEQVDLLPYDPKWEFSRNRLILGKQLGAGQFGVVFQAKQIGSVNDPEDNNPKTVAVKMIKPTFNNSSSLKSLATELKILIHVGHHLNVVNLLGACTKEIVHGELLVIEELCAFGNMHDYLIANRDSFINELHENGNDIAGELQSYVNFAQPQQLQEDNKGRSTNVPSQSKENLLPNETNASQSKFTHYSKIRKIVRHSAIFRKSNLDPDDEVVILEDFGYMMASEEELMLKNNGRITTRDLIFWSFQISSGMNHLASKMVIHGDLAARNVLLAHGNIVKIADFGLSRQTKYNDGTYLKQGGEALPIKWMALESLTDRIYTTQSDVWAYGVVLWELFSLGKLPYTDVTSLKDLIDFLQHGERLEQPNFMPDTMSAIMAQCWESEPKKRPTFSHLETELAKMIGEEVHNQYMKINPVAC